VTAPISLLQAPTPARGLPLARKGFRPFFLLAALFACLLVPGWLLVLTGRLPPPAYFDPVSWHAHEMVFGFAAAVIAGFLLTAVGNWTQRETLVGGALLGLAALWLAGRITMLGPAALPRPLLAVIDLAFLPALAMVLARPLVAARNRRNFVMLAILAALFVANLASHLEPLGVLAPGSARKACLAGVDVVLVVTLLIAGRVFPMFTTNATGVQTIRSNRMLDLLTIGGAAALALVDAVDRDGMAAAALSAVVAALAVARAARWGARHTLRHPLLWILHAGYAWIPIGLGMRAAAAVFPALPPSLATHALTVGAIGSLTLGMMARVALGHTGRALVAPRPVVWGFALMTAAAAARVVGPLIVPGAYLASLAAAAVLWTASFVTFVVGYAPILIRPRLDGRPG
jgi:uncharacterized protein involved in response to NO